MNPFQCDTKFLSGERCPHIASHVFRATFATRLICDDCRERYELENKYGAAHAIEEVSIAELMPARHHLLAEVRVTRQTLDKFEAMADADAEAAKRTMKIHAANTTGWIVAMVIGAWIHALLIMAGACTVWAIVSALAARDFKKRVAESKEDIDRRFGHPELSGGGRP